MLYRQILAVDPADFTASYQLGVMAFGQSRQADALNLFEAALSVRSQSVSALIMAGLALQGLARHEEALARFDAALEIEPGNEVAHSNRGGVLAALDRPLEALASFDRALAGNPDMVIALNNRGNVLLQLDRLEEALACFDRVLALAPDFSAALHSRAEAFSQLNRFGEALVNYRKALARDENHAAAWLGLGNALMAQGDVAAAQDAWRRALKQTRDDDTRESQMARENLALVLANQGHAGEALALLGPSLAKKPGVAAGKIFALCAQHLPVEHADPAFSGLLARALREAWGRPSEMAERAGVLLVDDTALRDGRFGDDTLAALGRNELLIALLTSTPNIHLGLEVLLAQARRALLERAENNDNAPLEFFAVLARQCFINEYVFPHDREELTRAARLRAQLISELEGDGSSAPLLVLAVAAYFPLAVIAAAPRLLRQNWPAPVEELLVTVVRESLEERQLADAIACLTPITGTTSEKVRAQYEEHPYPRWIRAALTDPASSVGGYLRQKFPLAGIVRDQPDTDILIAGCGTGQHAIATALKFPNTNILAVDLSRSSLAYAKRKSRELGLERIDYAQADLLELSALNRRFDVIESSGVLHHLANPFAGWKKLLVLLRPGGFMMLGFYSALGRRAVVRAREVLAREGYDDDADSMRRARQALMAKAAGDEGLEAILKSPDFFSLSACRDFLFHVEEHPVSLAEIAAFLRKNALTFLGFETGLDVLAEYRRRFPADIAAINLEQWHQFETANPDIFAGMYQFWVQKPLGASVS